MTIVILIIFGLALGSFVNALVWRLHSQQKAKSKKQKALYSISSGRSVCVHCKHKLAARDLVPVISWLWLRGKCRYCQRAISWQYPLVEIATAALFVASYVFWPETLTDFEWFVFAVWLISLVGLIALVVYDIRYMLLPNRIIFPLLGLVGLRTLVEVIVEKDLQPILFGLIGLVIGGGFFYLLFQISGGSWIGGGDVKLGFLLGLLIAGETPAMAAMVMLFIASLLGTLFSLPLMISGRLNPKTRIPFGPFLITAAIISQLFSRDILDAYYYILL